MTRAATWLLDGAENPLAPSSVVAELVALNPRLGLNYHVGLHAFMVTLRWPEHDPRRAYILSGEMSPDSDFEILCPVPANVSLDELHGWVQQQLRRVGETREDVRQMLAANEERVARQNTDVMAAVEAEGTDMLMESITRPSGGVGSRRKRVL